MYICIGKLVEINLPIHISSVIERCPVIEIYFEPVCQNIKEQRSFCIKKKIYKGMANWLKFGCSANNSNRVRFYGKTVIDGKVITSKKYRDAFSAIEWGEKQLNRECTGIYCITVSGAHIPMNVQFR